jgi:hypothetical protein
MGEPERQENGDQAEPELLYHYTTEDGLLSIVDSQELWATDVRFLNDASEFGNGLQIAIDMATQCSLGAGEDGLKTVRYLENVLKFEFSKRPVYSVSFSGPLKKGEELFSSIDDPGDRLNMWRSYSRRGISYSIGLSRAGWTTDIEGVDFQECSYLRETKEEYLTEILNNFGDLLNRCHGKRVSSVRDGVPLEWAMDKMREELDKCLEGILPDLKVQIAACKHESFWEEREWRLTVAPPSEHPKMFYTSGRFGITPRVRIGPCPHNE